MLLIQAYGIPAGIVGVGKKAGRGVSVGDTVEVGGAVWDDVDVGAGIVTVGVDVETGIAMAGTVSEDKAATLVPRFPSPLLLITK